MDLPGRVQDWQFEILTLRGSSVKIDGAFAAPQWGLTGIMWSSYAAVSIHSKAFGLDIATYVYSSIGQPIQVAYEKSFT
ncbi:hypothetical protein NQ317_005675 [Molorchus minor]|uniref:Uncharacterized protein n=1 Tax=Molorchus minor TaxID=1323400 RepID=A0ABQ9K842_9CUCU|nr:hypothetical protein NQ317_005675 [Molorchus minor]